MERIKFIIRQIFSRSNRVYVLSQYGCHAVMGIIFYFIMGGETFNPIIYSFTSVFIVIPIAFFIKFNSKYNRLIREREWLEMRIEHNILHREDFWVPSQPKPKVDPDEIINSVDDFYK